MTLHDFETHIERKILDRGFDYYEQDQVIRVEQFEKGEFSAKVRGSEQYGVYLQLGPGQRVIDHRCSCPYDWGAYCKHEVAVMYWLRESKAYGDEPNSDGAIEQIKQKLESTPVKELRRLMLEFAVSNPEFRNELRWHLGLELEEEDDDFGY